MFTSKASHEISLTFNVRSNAQSEVTVSKKTLADGLRFRPAKMLNILSFLILVGCTFAFHPITVPSHVLLGHVYRSLQDCDWLNCIQTCHDDPNCISYNFIRSTQGLGVCEMIDCGLEDLCDIKSQLMFSNGALFQQLASSGVRLIISILYTVLLYNIRWITMIFLLRKNEFKRIIINDDYWYMGRYQDLWNSLPDSCRKLVVRLAI